MFNDYNNYYEEDTFVEETDAVEPEPEFVEVVDEPVTTDLKEEGLVSRSLNLRKDPDQRNGNVIKVLKADTIVEVLEETGDWYKVKADGDTGYCMKEFIDIV